MAVPIYFIKKMMNFEEPSYRVYFHCGKPSHLGKNFFSLTAESIQYRLSQDKAGQSCVIPGPQKKLPDILQDTEESIK